MFAIVASAGVVLAAVYMIRLYQRSMHNPLAPGAESREMSVADGVVIVPIVAVILFLAAVSAVRARALRADGQVSSPRARWLAIR